MINKINAAQPIHKGQVTHHQDQLIVFVNFNIKNIRNNTVLKLNPLLVVELSFDIFLLFINLQYFLHHQYDDHHFPTQNQF